MLLEPQTSEPRRVLLVGGLDPCGGAGISADARTAAALGAFPLTVATCSTIQNRHGFESLHVVGEPVFTSSLRAVIEDGPIHAVKVGLIGVPRTLSLLLDVCAEQLAGVPVVVDPVLSATAGGLSPADDLVAAYQRGLARITLVTPNHPEAARLAPDGVAALALECAVLLTDGHGQGEVVEDRLFEGSDTHIFRHPRIDAGPIHGTGCALSTSVAVGLAKGLALPEACRRAVDFVAACVQRSRRSTDGLPVPIPLPPLGFAADSGQA